jgi:hypothetical protein
VLRTALSVPASSSDEKWVKTSTIAVLLKRRSPAQRPGFVSKRGPKLGGATFL